MPKRRPSLYLGAAMAAAAAAFGLLCPSGSFCFVLAGALTALLGLLFALAPRGRLLGPAMLALAGVVLALLCLGVQDVCRRAPADAFDGYAGEAQLEILSYGELTSGGRYTCYTVRHGQSGQKGLLYAEQAGLTPGDVVRAEVRISRPTPTDSFDYERYCRSRGIWLTVWAEGELIPCGRVRRLSHPLLWLSNDVRNRITATVGGDGAAVLCGVMLGGKTGMSDALSEAASRSGAGHMFAVSGMHLAILGSALLYVLKSRRAVFVLIPVCACFAVMTGLSPSVLRAAVMLLLPLLGPWLRREADGLNSLFFALWVLLLFNPAAIFSLSLQYSFGAMLGLMLFGGRLGAWLSRPAERLPRLLSRPFGFLASGTGAYLAANLFTLPITVLTFGQVPLAGLLANLALVWTLPFLFLGGYGLYLLALLLPAAAGAGAALLSPLLSYVLWAVRLFGRSLGPSFGHGLYLVWFLLFYALLLLGLARKPHRVSALWGVCCSGTLCLLLLLTSLQGATSAEVSWLSVGNGQCALLRDGGVYVLLDCGGEDAAALAAERLDREGIAAADLLILSHTDSDHANGVAELVRKGRVRRLILPSYAPQTESGARILQAAGQAQCEVLLLSEDVHVQLPHGSLSLFAPRTGAEQACITCLARLFRTDVFFAADISSPDELWLVRRGVLPELEVLCVAHHGSKHASSAPFLAATSPRTAVISVGQNSYGHPSREALSRLQAAGTEVYTTHRNGELTLTINGAGYRFPA